MFNQIELFSLLKTFEILASPCSSLSSKFNVSVDKPKQMPSVLYKSESKSSSPGKSPPPSHTCCGRPGCRRPRPRHTRRTRQVGQQSQLSGHSQLSENENLFETYTE